MDTSYVAPKLSFTPTLSSSTSASPARTGILRFHHPFEDSQSIQTPAIVHYTRKGTPVHLTRDNVDKLPIEMIQVAYEHLYMKEALFELFRLSLTIHSMQPRL